jgi:hypothetical protein
MNALRDLRQPTIATHGYGNGSTNWLDCPTFMAQRSSLRSIAVSILAASFLSCAAGTKRDEEMEMNPIQHPDAGGDDDDDENDDDGGDGDGDADGDRDAGLDAAMPPDAGTPQHDAGQPQPDAGSPEPDAGVEQTGLSWPDAQVPELCAGG